MLPARKVFRLDGSLKPAFSWPGALAKKFEKPYSGGYR
jgi:hypothetical protein